MKATLLLKDKTIWPDGTVIERVIWSLPTASTERPHGLKYRLYCGRDGKTLVRYDNETSKGDHIHYGAREVPYRFVSLTQLLIDFEAAVQRFLEEVTNGE